MKYPRKLVESSVELRHRGLKLKDTKISISKIFEIEVKSISTIWYWCQKFGKKFTEVIKGLGERLHCDETLLKTYQKGVCIYFWAVKCPITKCIVGWLLSYKRDLNKAKELFWEVRRHLPVTYFPRAIRTDSMPAYHRAIMSVFAHEVKHENVISFKHGNNVIENFWRCKHKFPIFRTLESAIKFVEHWVYEYNMEKLASLKISICFIIRRLKTISTHAVF